MSFICHFISLHIRSMWETICDAKAYRKCDGKFSAQNPQNTLFWNLVQNTPALENWNLGRSWHFGFDFPEHPHPHWNLGRSWHFRFWLSRTPPPPNLVAIAVCGDQSLYPPRIPSSFYQLLLLAFVCYHGYRHLGDVPSVNNLQGSPCSYHLWKKNK